MHFAGINNEFSGWCDIFLTPAAHGRFGSVSFFRCVMYRLAFTANRKSVGVSIMQGFAEQRSRPQGVYGLRNAAYANPMADA